MSARWPRRTIVRRRSAGPLILDEGGPLVSVVLPTYNRASLLPRAIESVLAQSVTDFELIVVDDGSSDNTTEIAGGYSDPRVRFIPLGANYGVSRPFNRGILEARSPLIAFLGDDDEWLPDLLTCLLARLDESPDCSLVYGQARWSGYTGEFVSETPEGHVLDHLLGGSIQVCGSACLVKRAALLELGGFDESIRQGEDTDLWLRMAAAGHQFAVVRKPLAIVHYEHELGRVTEDPINLAITLQRFHTRWGPLARERLGTARYEQQRTWRSQRLHRRHRKLVRNMMRKGHRRDAWRYAFRMRKALPWSTRYVMQATGVALFGRWPYRMRRAAKKLLNVHAADRAGDDQSLDL